MDVGVIGNFGLASPSPPMDLGVGRNFCLTSLPPFMDLGSVDVGLTPLSSSKDLVVGEVIRSERKSTDF